MGLARLILNTILFIVTFILILIMGYGLMFALTLPTGETTVDRVHMVATEDEVDYLDAIVFWGSTVKGNFEAEPEYLVRGWFDWEMWQEVGLYPDIAIKYVKGAFTPFAMPMYELRQIATYNGADDTWNLLLTESQNLDLASIISLQSFQDISNHLNLSEDQKASLAGALITRDNWKEDYTEFYNIDLRMEKYNTDYYDSLMVKFIEDEGLGLRRISGVAVTLFYQILFTFILTIMYVHQHPITLRKGEDSQSEVEGDLVPVKLPGYKKRKQKRKAKKIARMQKQLDNSNK